MTEANVLYDARTYPDLFYERGGAQGHSGAYIQIYVGINNYAELKSIKIEAEQEGSDFEVTLREDDRGCVGTWPFESVDQWFSAWLGPDHIGLKGDWKITLKYKTLQNIKGTEIRHVVVPRFNFPPEPTGIQISEDAGRTWIAWNSIGAPGVGPARHVEYRLARVSPPPAACVTEFYPVRPGGIEYQMWSGNRIAVPLPAHWMPGDLVRIENRVYDDNGGAVYRFDRGVRYFFQR